MFWIGCIVGILFATIVIGGWIAFSCKLVYGNLETFSSMCDVTIAACENRESVIKVFHDGEELEATAVFEKL